MIIPALSRAARRALCSILPHKWAYKSGDSLGCDLKGPRIMCWRRACRRCHTEQEIAWWGRWVKINDTGWTHNPVWMKRVEQPARAKLKGEDTPEFEAEYRRRLETNGPGIIEKGIEALEEA